MELKPQDLSKEWSSGKFRRAYYLLGQPDDVKDALAELKKRFKADSFNLSEFSRETDPPSAALSDALTQPVFADRRLVIVAHPKIVAQDPDAFLDYLKNPVETTTLVLVSHDKSASAKDRLVAPASAAGAVCVFQPLKPWDTPARLIKEAARWGKSLAPDAAELIVEEAGCDWHVLRQEIEKATLYVGQAKAITRQDILACLGYHRGADGYLLTKHVAQRDLKGCLSHLQAVFSAGKAEDHVYPLLAQIRNAVSKQLRARRMLRQGTGEHEVLDALRLRSKFYDGYLQWLRPLTESRLTIDLRACLSTEVGLKSKTWLDPRQEVERLAVRLCRHFPPRRGGK
ncbi:MAG: DNA polymerase III subunit delta [Elusimicrobia bacterium]|nr:DNA polymerase III subunit delta [Elusimicrobiota bacterium]